MTRLHLKKQIYMEGGYMLDNILYFIVGIFILMWFGLYAIGFMVGFIDEIKNKMRNKK